MSKVRVLSQGLGLKRGIGVPCGKWSDLGHGKRVNVGVESRDAVRLKPLLVWGPEREGI